MSEGLSINLPARRAYAGVAPPAPRGAYDELRVRGSVRATVRDPTAPIADFRRDLSCELADLLHIRKHRMTGEHRLTGSGRRTIAQAVLLLRTEFDLTPETAEQRSRRQRAANLVLGGLGRPYCFSSPKLVLVPLWIVGAVVALLSIAMWAWHGASMLLRRMQHRPAEQGPSLPDCWPFASESDLNEARSRRVYLCGITT